jgi:hypothetical protein
MNDKAHHIKERFPADKRAIDHLLVLDPEFGVICEDHQACIAALQYWVDSNAPEAGIRIDEYRSLIEGLESEAARAIAALKERP